MSMKYCWILLDTVYIIRVSFYVYYILEFSVNELHYHWTRSMANTSVSFKFWVPFILVLKYQSFSKTCWLVHLKKLVNTAHASFTNKIPVKCESYQNLITLRLRNQWKKGFVLRHKNQIHKKLDYPKLRTNVCYSSMTYNL